MTAEYKISVNPQLFFYQNTGLAYQTCNHSAICAGQSFSGSLFQCCIVTCTHPERPFSTSNCLVTMSLQCEKVIMYIAMSAKYTYLYFYYPTIKMEI